MLTDAETVVLPVWLHHRPSPTEGATAEDAAAFLKTITAPPQPDEAPVTEPETGERVAHEPDAEAEAGTGTGTGAEADAEVASGAGEAGTAGGPPEREPADGGQDDAGTDEAERAEAAEAKVAEAEAEAGAGTEADAKADSNSK